MEEQIHNQKNQTTAPAIIIAGALIAVAIFMSFGRGKQTIENNQPAVQEPPAVVPENIVTVRDTDFVLGDASKAEVVIFEYSDSDCPFCSRFHETIKTLASTYGDRIAFVYRFYPLDQLHPNARTEALALACVGSISGNQSFWNYLDKVMSVTLTPSSNLTVLTTFAREESIDTDDFESCVRSGRFDDRVQADIDEGASIGVRGTPYSIAVSQKSGQQLVIPGALGVEDVSRIIDTLSQ
jgi:protein-disulfide isomerase